jgi:hypothetical protein
MAAGGDCLGHEYERPGNLPFPIEAGLMVVGAGTGRAQGSAVSGARRRQNAEL